MIDSPEVLARTGGRELRRIVYDEATIHRRVEEVGEAIAAAYPPDEELLLVGLLKGSFIFVGDLVRAIARPLQVDFLVASSYGSGTTSSGEVRLIYDPEADLRDRHAVDEGLGIVDRHDRLVEPVAPAPAAEVRPFGYVEAVGDQPEEARRVPLHSVGDVGIERPERTVALLDVLGDPAIADPAVVARLKTEYEEKES